MCIRDSTYLGDLVPRSPNLDKRLFGHLGLGCHDRSRRVVLRLLRGAARKVHLVFFPLDMGQVRPIVGVHSEAKAALDVPRRIAQRIGILGQVERLERELAQPLAAVERLLARIRDTGTLVARAVLIVWVSERDVPIVVRAKERLSRDSMP